jgi:pyruvate/2-oxoglutarate dehydrogenase complex dihydrolipoamide dehydrogenase (E3) component
MRYDVDFLVIGSGIGGLTFALKVAEYGNVAVVTKKEAMETSTTAPTMPKEVSRRSLASTTPLTFTSGTPWRLETDCAEEMLLKWL